MAIHVLLQHLLCDIDDDEWSTEPSVADEENEELRNDVSSYLWPYQYTNMVITLLLWRLINEQVSMENYQYIMC